MRRILLVLPVVAATAIVIVIATRSHDRRPMTTEPQHAMLRLSTPHTRSPSLAIGSEHAYDVTFSSAVRPQGGQDVRVAVTGTWAVAYAGDDEQGLVFRAELRGAAPLLNGTAVAAEPFGVPYYFTLTEEGRLAALHVPHGLDELARGTLTSLAVLAQRSAVASDSIGDYEVDEVAAGDGVRRRRVRYQRLAAGGDISADIVTSGTNLALRADGWPETISGHEVTRVSMGEMSVVGDQQFTLRHAGVARIDPGWFDGLDVVAVDAAASRARADDLDDRELVDGTSFADLLAELARISDEHARAYQFLRISALLRHDDSAVAAAAQAVAADDPAAGVVIAALGEAGTPRAQTALATMLDSAGLDSERRAQAAIALGLTKTPTPATLAALAAAARQHDEVGDTALLALGNAARSADAETAVDELLARLASAASDEERALVLRALGNTGDPRIMPAVIASLATGDIVVRTAAAEALRFVAGSEPTIAACLRDGAPDVRSAAIFAAAQRDLGVLAPALAGALQHDPDVSVRRAIVQLAAGVPVLRPLLVDAAAHDSDRDLRETARKLLEADVSG